MLSIIIGWAAFAYLAVGLFFGNIAGRVPFLTRLAAIAVLAVITIVFTVVRVVRVTSGVRKTAARGSSAPAGSSGSVSATDRPAGRASGGDPDPEDDPSRLSVTFRVAGVTFDNDDGTSRQDILRHLRFRDPPYADQGDQLDLDFTEEDFEGEPALAVTLNGYQVGYVPRAKISRVSKILDEAWETDDVAIYGGDRNADGSARSFGCSVTISCDKPD